MAEITKKGIVEALIFAAHGSISPTRLSQIASLESAAQVDKIIEELNGEYRAAGRAFRIVKIAGGYEYFTAKSYAPFVSDLYTSRESLRITSAMLEVLSIVALKQPVTKPVIDKIRAADSGGTIHTLLEQGLISIRGREKSPGRPFIYVTTARFLKAFGLDDIKDLPEEAELPGLFSDAEEDKLTDRESEPENPGKFEIEVPHEDDEVENSDEAEPEDVVDAGDEVMDFKMDDYEESAD